MAVSSLVITTNSEFKEIQRQQLQEDYRVTLGEAQGCFIPLVTETESVGDARDLAERILKLEGVLDAQLVSWVEDPLILGDCDEA